MRITHLATTTTTYLAADSPFSGITPDFTVFGAQFTTWWQKMFAGLLALLLVYTGAKLVIALAAMHRARSTGVAGQVDEAKSSATYAGIAFAAVIVFVPITVAIFAAVTPA